MVSYGIQYCYASWSENVATKILCTTTIRTTSTVIANFFIPQPSTHA
jgi:hypothetical protein